MDFLHVLLTMAVGAVTGLLGGTFGKGGSAIASPLLAAVGIKPFAALASPLPATIPATLIAALAYYRAGYVDQAVLRTTVVVGVPATVVGALLSGLVGGGPLVLACDVILALLGVRVLTAPRGRPSAPMGRPSAPKGRPSAPKGRPSAPMGRPSAPMGRPSAPMGRPSAPSARFEDQNRAFGAGARPIGDTLVVAAEIDRRRLVATAAVVGLASGLLANSGGFLLAPLFVTFLGLPLKRALGTSLAAAAVLAGPGTIVHVAMGHVDWSVAVPFALASVPLSATGARLALRADADRLTTVYGAALLVVGLGLLVIH